MRKEEETGVVRWGGGGGWLRRVVLNQTCGDPILISKSYVVMRMKIIF